MLNLFSEDKFKTFRKKYLREFTKKFLNSSSIFQTTTIKLMKMALLSHNSNIAYQKELRNKQQQQKTISLQDIQLFSQDILQRYTNNMRMQIKQQLVQIKCPKISNDISQQSQQLRKKDLKIWLSELCHSVFSIAYNSYKKSQISENEMKIYCSENLLLNLIKLSESNNLSVQDYEYIDNVLKNDILSYYKDKYPPTLQKQSYKRFRAEIQNIDIMEDLQQQLIKVSKFQEQFEKRYSEKWEKNVINPQYYDLIMQLINYCSQLPDKKCNVSQQNSKSYYDQFNELMAGIFSRVEDLNFMRTKDIYNYEYDQKNNSKSPKQQKQQQEYRQKVKGYTNYKIGRKIPQHVHKFTEEQIKNQNIRIQDPAILRFLTKWLQQLEENLENIQSKLASVGWNLNQYITYKDIQEIKTKRKQLLKVFQNKIYQQQQFCDYYYLNKKQIHTIPKSDQLVGVFSYISNQNQANFIVKSINSLIQDLCKLSYCFAQFIFPSITCKVGDLIRCKCSSKQKEILKIYQLIKHQQSFKIVRIKNRLQKGTKDILINVLFKQTILCEIQLSINQDQSSQKTLNNFNHYLYQLQRSKFGPINELANIWAKDQRYQHIAKWLQKNWKKNTQSQCQCKKIDIKQQKNPFPFICNNCDRYYDKDISFISHKKCENCKFWKCSNCCKDQIVKEQAERQELLKQYYQKDDCQLISLQNQDAKIPKYGMFISTVSKKKDYIEFKSFELPDQTNIYLVKAEGNINKIFLTISKSEQKQFFNDKIVFRIKKINSIQQLDDLKFKKTLLLPKNIKILYKNQTEALKLASNSLTVEQFAWITTGEQKNYEKIKQINLCSNNIEEMDPIISRFQNIQTLKLNKNNIVSIPKSIQNLKQLKILNIYQSNVETIDQSFGYLPNLKILQLFRNKIKVIPQSFRNLENLTKIWLSQNQIETIPQSLGSLKKLTMLQLWSNNIENIPQSLGNLQSLTELNLSQNKIKAIPQSMGNLKKLTILQLWSNNIESIPQSLGNLQNLTHLILNHNKIKIIPQSLANLKKLTMLQLRSNNIERLPQSLGNLQSLTELSISQNNIERIPQSLENLKNLTELWISQNNIKIIPQSLGNLQSLTELNLSSNKIKVIPQSMGNLKNLRKLQLSQNNIEMIAKSISLLHNLQLIDLSNNKITITRQFLSLFMKMKTQVNLYNNEMPLSQQDYKWIESNHMDKKIRFMKQ